jgi:hypothetical protein
VKAIEQPNYSIYVHDPKDFLINGMMKHKTAYVAPVAEQQKAG